MYRRRPTSIDGLFTILPTLRVISYSTVVTRAITRLEQGCDPTNVNGIEEAVSHAVFTQTNQRMNKSTFSVSSFLVFRKGTYSTNVLKFIEQSTNVEKVQIY